jgi:hypothetical protein
MTKPDFVAPGDEFVLCIPIQNLTHIGSSYKININDQYDNFFHFLWVKIWVSYNSVDGFPEIQY